jgi:phosphoribosylaminoimidazole-succinocarboxamide synthase
MRALARTEIPELRLVHRGKVRDVYEVDAEHWLLVATDRLSAFDVVLPDPIPGKGVILTQLSLFWFGLLGDLCPNHLVEADVRAMPRPIPAHARLLRGRSILVRRAEVFPVECIARGYLLGSAWKDYQRTGRVAGEALPPGLKKNHRFDRPLFTPSTKAVAGHDENLDFEGFAARVGPARAEELRTATLAVFARARDHAALRGVVLADTKLEWGRIAGETALVDEVLTPDSSRFWRAEDAARCLPDRDPPSYDKQVVRDHLESLDWNKQAPGPALPGDVIATTRARYIEIHERITGRPVPDLDD